MSRTGDLDRGLTIADKIVIAGASAAGISVADSLRQRGFTGRITLLGTESQLPYDRPRLSRWPKASRLITRVPPRPICWRHRRTDVPSNASPYFWTDQYDLKLQA